MSFSMKYACLGPLKEIVRKVAMDWPCRTFMTCSANFVLDSIRIGIMTQISIIVNTSLIMN